MGDNGMIIRCADTGDLDSISDIHSKAMPDALLVRTGRYFLERTLYPFALKDNDTRVYVAQTPKGVEGVAIYGRCPETFQHHIAANKLHLLISVLLQKHRAPALLLNILKAKSGTAVHQSRPGDSLFHLFLIAVSTHRHRSGIGTVLMEKSLSDAAAFFDKRCCLVDARTENAYRFYKKNGFRDIGVEIRGADKYFQLLKEI